MDHIDETLADLRSDVRALHTDLQANTATTQRVATDTADLVTITRSVYGLARFILWIGAAAGAVAAVWQVFKGT